MLIRYIRNLKILPRWVIVTIDLSFIFFSCLFAYLLRFNFYFPDLLQSNFIEGSLLYIACGLAATFLTGSYRGIVRYTGLEDGVRIFYLVLVNLLLVTTVNLIYYYQYQANLIPYSVILITLLSSFLFLFNYRLLVKYIFAYYKYALLRKFRVLVYGAGQTGMIARHVVNSTPRMQVVGFLEDDMRKVGKVLDGAKIFSAQPKKLVRLFENLNVDELVITIKDMSLDKKNELVDLCIQYKIKVRTIPPVRKWANGELSFNQIKEINIEDLLGRHAIKLENEALNQDIQGKRILITGAAGSIGSEIVRLVIQYHPGLIILVDQAESPLYEIEREVRGALHFGKVITHLADITNLDRIRPIFEEHKPDIVYHAAAYKHVPMMEGNPSEAVSCNILGTKVIADLSVACGVRKFVMISTDKAVNPTNVMGCSKRIAEIYVQALDRSMELNEGHRTLFVTTRFGNVLGSNGSVIPLFKKQISQGGPITVTHPEVTRYFMTIPEACQLVLEAGVMGKGGEIFIFDMGQAVKIIDLARKMIRLSGLEPDKDIEIVFTGLREGEKLYEELLNNFENTMPTHHEKIMIAKVQECSYEEINRYVELFNDLAFDKNELKMVALMKELVPEYRSSYSRYEVLDS